MLSNPHITIFNPKTKLLILRIITPSTTTISIKLLWWNMTSSLSNNFRTPFKPFSNQTKILKLGFENNLLIRIEFASKSKFSLLPLFTPYNHPSLQCFFFNTIIKANAQNGNLKATILWVFNFMLECKSFV